MQNLVNGAIEDAQKVAQAVAKAPNTTKEDLENAKVDGAGELTPQELAQINELINKANPKPVTIAELQALVNEGKELANKVKAAVDAGAGENNTTAEKLHAAGITPDTITPEQMKQINENLDKVNPKPQTQEELQNLINGAIEDAQKVAQTVAKAPNITKEDLNNTRVDSNVTEQELAQINELINKANPKPQTTGELQALVNEGKELANKVKEAVEAGAGENNTTAEKLHAAGITPEDLNNSVMKQINENLDKVNPKPQTQEELQNLVNGAIEDAQKVAQAVAKAPNTTKEDLENAKVDGAGELTPQELAQINELINKANPKPVTTGELGKLVEEGKKLAGKVEELIQKAPNIDNNDTQNLGLRPEIITPEELKEFNKLVENADPKPNTKDKLQELLNSAILSVNLKVEHTVDGNIKVSGKATPVSTVTVKFPDGTQKEVQTDENGTYSITSDDAIEKGLVRVSAVDDQGVGSNEIDYYVWFKKVEDNDSISITYSGNENKEIQKEEATKIIIDKKLEVTTKEENNGTKIELEIKAPTSNPAPEIATKELPECKDKDYVAYVVLDKQNGEVETGFTFDDSKCSAKFKDATVYDNKPLKFVPGTEVQIKDTNDKGGKVIIVDAILEKSMKFGER